MQVLSLIHLHVYMYKKITHVLHHLHVHMHKKITHVLHNLHVHMYKDGLNVLHHLHVYTYKMSYLCACLHVKRVHVLHVTCADRYCM